MCNAGLITCSEVESELLTGEAECLRSHSHTHTDIDDASFLSQDPVGC